jgi:hypothetical protein
MQRGHDFRGHRNAAARQRQYDRIVALVALKRSCELLSGFGPVAERHDRLSALARGRLCRRRGARIHPEIALEPALGSVNHHFQRARLGKETARAGTISSAFGPQSLAKACSLSSITP